MMRIEIGDFRRTIPSDVLFWLLDSGVDLVRWRGYDQVKFRNAVIGVLQYVDAGLIEDNFLGRKVLEEWRDALLNSPPEE